MRLLIAVPEPVHGHMGIDLRGGEAAVPEDFLDGTQVGAAVEKMRRRAMPQRVRSRGGGITQRLEQPAYHGADLPGIDAVTPDSQEQGRPASCSCYGWAAPPDPVVHGQGSRDAEWYGALFVTLSEHTQGSSVRVQIINVQSRKFAHPDTCGVKQLNHCPVAEGHRTTALGGDAQVINDAGDLLLLQDAREGLAALGGLQPHRWVGEDQFFPERPAGEGPGRRRTSGQRSPGHSSFTLGTKPTPKRPELQLLQFLDPLFNSESEKALNICRVGADGVG